MRRAWDEYAAMWTTWARTPGHDSYRHFHGERFFELVPPPGRLTLDLGAGEGRVARTSARAVTRSSKSTDPRARGASYELSQGMVVNADMARLPLVSGVADLAIAFMCLHDVDEMPAAVAEAARVLVPGGHLVMAIVHPINSAGRFDPVQPGQGEADRPFVVRGSYFEELRYADDIVRNGLSMRFESEHRPLESYARALEAAGFAIEAIREVGESNPADKWYRMPLFLDLRAVRV